ncbi:MAG: hypothetical protein MHMPM18_000316 [Marteilia pararefringens]
MDIFMDQTTIVIIIFPIYFNEKQINTLKMTSGCSKIVLCLYLSTTLSEIWQEVELSVDVPQKKNDMREGLRKKAKDHNFIYKKKIFGSNNEGSKDEKSQKMVMRQFAFTDQPTLYLLTCGSHSGSITSTTVRVSLSCLEAGDSHITLPAKFFKELIAKVEATVKHQPVECDYLLKQAEKMVEESIWFSKCVYA